jgi:hypothetical protein
LNGKPQSPPVPPPQAATPPPAPPGAIPAETLRVAVPPSAPRRTAPRRGTAPPPAPPAAPVEQFGYLILDATPVSGTVFVDGVNAGDTPLYNYKVKPGLRNIRIQSEGYRPLTDRLQVDVGNTVRKRYTLIPE